MSRVHDMVMKTRMANSTRQFYLRDHEINYIGLDYIKPAANCNIAQNIGDLRVLLAISPNDESSVLPSSIDNLNKLGLE